MASNITVTDNETNYLYQKNDIYEVFKGENEYLEASVTVVASTEYKAGTALSFDAATNTYAITNSAATPTHRAVAVLANNVPESNTSTTLKLTICIKGYVDEDKLIFGGSDTINTVAADTTDTYKSQLRNYGIIAQKYKSLN